MVGLHKRLLLGIAGLTTLSGLLLYSEIKENFKKTENLEIVKEDTAPNYLMGDTDKEYEIEDTLEKRKEFIQNAKKSLEKVVNNEIIEKNLVWEALGLGLDYGKLSPNLKSKNEDPNIGSLIQIVKINPSKYSLELLMKSEKGGNYRTAEQWTKEFNLVGAINAGMFRADYKTSCGYAINGNHVNNSKFTPDYNSVLAFNAVDSSVPPVQIIDLKHQNFDLIKPKYKSFVQNLRMIDLNGKNTWYQSDKIWSIASIGIDKQNNVLFMFSRSPYSVHDFINILKNSPLDIKNAMYCEGGPEATLYLSKNGKIINEFGSYETGFNQNHDNNQSWNIPNVVGIKEK